VKHLQLDFDLLEDLLLARQQGYLRGASVSPTGRIAPLIEVVRAEGILNGSLQLVDGTIVSAIRRALQTRLPVFFDSGTVGIVSAVRRAIPDDGHWLEFGLTFQKACVATGHPIRIARGIVGALMELERNIHEHSERPETGILAYRATPQDIEFVVADAGIGMLRSMKRGYPELRDPGISLRLALTDGYSRFGATMGRGFGFRELFLALATHRGELRFRSDDQVLSISGISPSLVNSVLAQGARLDGFSVACVCCTAQ
jgi:hypothetical protein